MPNWWPVNLLGYVEVTDFFMKTTRILMWSLPDLNWKKSREWLLLISCVITFLSSQLHSVSLSDFFLLKSVLIFATFQSFYGIHFFKKTWDNPSHYNENATRMSIVMHCSTNHVEDRIGLCIKDHPIYLSQIKIDF